MRRFIKGIFPILALCLVFSCNDNGTGPDPGDDSEDDNSDPTTGSVEITTSTIGDNQDPDGYTVMLGESEEEIDSNGSVTFEDLEEGSYDAELTGVAEHCSIDGENPKSVDVTAGETASLDFSITCMATSGALEVTTETGGEDLDSDGYTLQFAERDTSIGLNETITIEGLDEGVLNIELIDLASNCLTQSTSSREVTISLGDTTETTFNIGCQATSGAGKVVFSSDRDDNPSDDEQDIYVMNPDGSNVENLTDDGYINTSPVVSPDGSKIAFISNRNTGIAVTDYDIFVMNSDGSNIQRIANNAIQYTDLSWSPDGSQLVTADNVFRIGLINSDGSGDEQYFGSIPDDRQFESVSWSPDGDKIVLGNAGGIDNVVDIAKINPDDTGYEEMLLSVSTASHIRYSPDGSKLAFVAETQSGTGGIWTINTDGSDLQQLTDKDATQDLYPDWSPDGTELMFQSPRNQAVDQHDTELFKMNADGSGSIERITDNDVVDVAPFWVPELK